LFDIFDAKQLKAALTVDCTRQQHAASLGVRLIFQSGLSRLTNFQSEAYAYFVRPAGVRGPTDFTEFELGCKLLSSRE